MTVFEKKISEGILLTVFADGVGHDAKWILKIEGSHVSSQLASGALKYHNFVLQAVREDPRGENAQLVFRKAQIEFEKNSNLGVALRNVIDYTNTVCNAGSSSSKSGGFFGWVKKIF